MLKFGLIPELVGRLPAVVTLDNLDEDALVRILTEPKNAIVKQYQYLFAVDGVQLEFTEEALHAIAAQAVKRQTGARGLRAIVEEFINDLMFDLPDRPDLEKVIITADVVNGTGEPEYIINPDRKPISRGKKKVPAKTGDAPQAS